MKFPSAFSECEIPEETRLPQNFTLSNKRLSLREAGDCEVDFDMDFARGSNVTLELEDNKINLRIFLDQSSVEVFANNGKIAMTNLIFPDPTQNQVQAYVKGGSVTITTLDTWMLKGIWPKEGEEEVEDAGTMKSHEFLRKIMNI